MRDSAAVKFSEDVPRLEIVCSKRFWYEPSLERSPDTLLIALSIAVIALFALPWSLTLIPTVATACALTCPSLTIAALESLFATLNVAVPVLRALKSNPA